MPSFFVTLPVFPTSAYHGDHGVVAPLFAEAGLPFIDLVDPYILEFGEGTSKELKWATNPANGHPGPVANDFYARRIADILERDYAEVLGPKSDRPQPWHARINDWLPADMQIDASASAEIKLTYPSDPKLMLKMPWLKPYVQLNLEKAALLNGVRIMGNDLKEATLYYTQLYPGANFDNHEVLKLESLSGNEPRWDLTRAGMINTIRFTADFAGVDRALTVVMVPR